MGHDNRVKVHQNRNENRDQEYFRNEGRDHSHHNKNDERNHGNFNKNDGRDHANYPSNNNNRNRGSRQGDSYDNYDGRSSDQNNSHGGSDQQHGQRNNSDQNGSRNGSTNRRRDHKKNFERSDRKGDEPSSEVEDQQKPLIKQTPAAPPSTNIWEERAKKQQLQQKEDTRSLTFVPTEEDKKRTLKETAPIKQNERTRNTSGFERKASSDSNSCHSTNITGKRNGSPKPKYEENTKRNTSPSSKAFQRPRRENQHHHDAGERKRGGRGGRGASGRGNYSSNVRGRGRRGNNRYSSTYNKATIPFPSQGRYQEHERPPRSLLKNGEDKVELKEHTADEILLSDTNDAEEIDRRRQLGENSDVDGLSSNISNSDHETEEAYLSKQSKKSGSHAGKIASMGSNTDANGGARSFKSNSRGAFAARGAPSRRGRGRNSWGNNHGGKLRGDVETSSTNSTGFTQSTTGSSFGRENSQNDSRRDVASTRRSKHHDNKGAHGSFEARNTDDKRNDSPKHPGEKSRKKRGVGDRPPRFNNYVRSGSYEGSFKRGPGGEDWETASDRSAEQKKQSNKGPERTESKRGSSSGRGFSNNHGRGGNGRGSQQHGGYSKRNSSNQSQVFMLHSVKYNDPSAIAGAIAASTGVPSSTKTSNGDTYNEEKKRLELFQKYGLHSGAGVVNVEDLPEASQQSLGEDEDGFTPVLSKRQQKKLQEEKKR